MADLYTFTVKTPEQIRDDGLRTLRNGLIARGIANPNVGPTSDYFAEFQAFANELAVVEANAVIKSDATMIDTAQGDELIAAAAAYGLAPRDAAGSIGPATFSSTAPSLVPTGAELIDSAGLRYAVSTGGTFSTGDTINVAAIDAGDATNLAEGDALRWVATPPYASTSMAVGAGGLVNGVDAEDQEGLRARLLEHVRNAPSGGNSQHVAEICEEASGAVQKAFVYPAYQGGATLAVAVTAQPTATNKSRELAAATVTSVVEPTLIGSLPEHAKISVTTVEDVTTTIKFSLSLPSAKNASPSGPGGGWKDGTPWPAYSATTSGDIQTVYSTTDVVVKCSSSSAPREGVTRVAWVSPVEWKVYGARILAATDLGSNLWRVVLDAPLVGIAAGDIVFPQMENQQAYVDAVLAAFRFMGPGEKLDSGNPLITRAYRHPPNPASWPSGLAGFILRAISDAGDEVLSADYLYRLDGDANSITGSGGSLTPDTPATVDDPPKQYVPYRFGFFSQ